jgi:hypothetical protein
MGNILFTSSFAFSPNLHSSWDLAIVTQDMQHKSPINAAIPAQLGVENFQPLQPDKTVSD